MKKCQILNLSKNGAKCGKSDYKSQKIMLTQDGALKISKSEIKGYSEKFCLKCDGIN